MILRVEGLTRTYGDIKAVDALDLALDAAELLAVAGPDGAGKTSLFRALAGLIDFDAGTATIAGYDVRTEFDRIKPILGYMPQSFSLYPDLSVEENLRFYSGLFGMSRSEFDEKKDQLYAFSGLKPFVRRRAGNLSGGMKQKLALSCALVHDPKVLILDEPTTGVDPLSRRQFWEILLTLKSTGSSILVSTPYMDEVDLTDRAVLIHKGRKLAEGSPSELSGLFRGVVYRLREQPTRELMKIVGQIPNIAARRFGSTVRITAPEDYTAGRIDEDLRRAGVTKRVERVEPELEDTFVQMLEG
jgi:ABC-2 type transport system ATP-binding protein